LDKKLLFGMISQLQENVYYLEDLDSYIRLDLSAAEPTFGLVTENSFVLVEGDYEDNQSLHRKDDKDPEREKRERDLKGLEDYERVFKVKQIAFPPCESISTTNSLFAHVDFLGIPKFPEDHESLKLIERESKDIMFVILSDVWLDRPEVVLKLEELFEGYKDIVPTCFILFGNFLSDNSAFEPGSSLKLKVCFDNLTDLILHYPKIAKGSKFLLIPGPNDPGGGKVWPRGPLPLCLTEKFRHKIPGVENCSNPCRMKYCTQTILLYRDDVILSLQRNAILPPSHAEPDIKKHAIRTLVDGGHLAPFSLNTRPIYWSRDHALSLYPVPEVSIIADRFEPFTTSYAEGTFMNPGSFLNSDFSFMVYYPWSRKPEMSKID